MKNILKSIARVVIMMCVLHTGYTIVSLLSFRWGHANGILCLLGYILAAIAVLVSSYFMANMWLEEQDSKVKKILLRPLCLLLICLAFRFLLANFWIMLI